MATHPSQIVMGKRPSHTDWDSRSNSASRELSKRLWWLFS